MNPGRFRFSLDPALRLRKRLEEHAQVALAQEQTRLKRERAAAVELRLMLQRQDARAAAVRFGAMDPEELSDAERYREGLARALALQDERIARAEIRVKAALEILTARQIDREALERLRERRLTEYRAEEARLEQASLDEVGILGWRRGVER